LMRPQVRHLIVLVDARHGIKPADVEFLNQLKEYVRRLYFE
jgi:GTP-binding protein EngB required for normal cell division